MTIGPKTYVLTALATATLSLVAIVGAAVLSRHDVHLAPLLPLAPAPDAPVAPPPGPAPRLELLVISASWCLPCRQLHAELDAHPELLQAAGVVVTVVTDDKTAERDYKVQYFPTIVLLRDGKETARRTGKASAAELAAWVGAKKEDAAPP